MMTSTLLEQNTATRTGDGGRVRVVLAGAAPDTGNLGVSALAYSCIEGLLSRLPGCELTVLDFGRGVRRATSAAGASYTLCGAKHSRRLYQPETMWQIRIAARLGGLNNPAARRILRADAVLDISGGDSFADLYGPRRFKAVAATKQLALAHGIPLILLPQTYGPFESAEIRREASRIVRESELAWARDVRSFESMKSLVGEAFDARKHRCGVDVAFGLLPEEPAAPLGDRLASWLGAGREREVAGVNVSGLLYNDAAGAKVQYGLKADYRRAVEGLVSRVLRESGANVMLMPHVVTASGHYESDVDACEAVKRAVAAEGAGRVEVAPALGLPGQAKWVISKVDWFCGTRMHATIAGLSSGVATAAIAYSVKTQGVFESCGQGEHVADPRTLGTDEVVGRLWRSWETREEARESLRRELPRTVRAAAEQMDAIAETCRALSRAREGRSAR